MQACEAILATRKRVDHSMMIEVVRKIQPALVAGVGIKIGEHFVHAAKLSVEHLLSLGFIKFGKNRFGPRGKLDLQFQRGAVAGEAVSVSQPRVGLVQGVPGRPETVEIKKT